MHIELKLKKWRTLIDETLQFKIILALFKNSGFAHFSLLLEDSKDRSRDNPCDTYNWK